MLFVQDSGTYIVRWPPWVGGVIAIGIMSALYAAIAEGVRRTLGAEVRVGHRRIRLTRHWRLSSFGDLERDGSTRTDICVDGSRLRCCCNVSGAGLRNFHRSAPCRFKFRAADRIRRCRQLRFCAGGIRVGSNRGSSRASHQLKTPLPNMRLKLAAPVHNRCGVRRKRRCARFSFVTTSAWRRSLSAIR